MPQHGSDSVFPAKARFKTPGVGGSGSLPCLSTRISAKQKRGMSPFRGSCRDATLSGRIAELQNCDCSAYVVRLHKGPIRFLHHCASMCQARAFKLHSFNRGSLRENSSYDVLCWATDAIGNDIMQSMVMLPLPWADTSDPTLLSKKI